jgi:hypothetical protein
MKTIALTKGKVTLVDDADHEELTKYKWHATESSRGKFYARTAVYFGKEAGTKSGNKMMFMHRMLLPDAPTVDHIDSNGLNNCRNNLRKCSQKENTRNSQKQKKKAGFKGTTWISWEKGKKGKWVAQIQTGGKRFYLGCFEREVDAARAYDAAALKHFGEFAKINFPPSPLPFILGLMA